MKTKLIIVFVALLMVAGSLVFADEEQKLSFNREANGDVTVFKLVPLEVMPKVPPELPGVEAYALKHGVKNEVKIEGKPIEELVLSFFMKSEVAPRWTIYKYAKGDWPANPQTGEKVVSTNYLFAALFQYLIPLFVFCVYIFYGLTNTQMVLLCCFIVGGATFGSLVSLAGNEAVTSLFGVAAACGVLRIIKSAGVLTSFLIVFIGWGSGLFLYSLVQKEIFTAAIYLAAFCPLAFVLAIGAKWVWQKYREE